MVNIGTVKVKVDPEVMRSQAAEVRRLGNELKSDFREIENIIMRTNNYWIGEAGDAHRNLYNDQKEDIVIMLKRLSEHPDDLEQISENYKSAEGSNVSKVQILPKDVIS